MTDFTSSGRRYFGAPDLLEDELAAIFQKYGYRDPRGAARFAKSAPLLYRATDADLLASFLLSHGVAASLEIGKAIASDIREVVLKNDETKSPPG